MMLRWISAAPCVLFLLAFDLCAQGVPAGPGDWPQWRGPNRDGVSNEKNLLKQWPTEGPKVLWRIESVGTGYSSLAVKDGRIITQGDLEGVEQIVAIDAKTGSTLWTVQPGPVAQLLETRIAADLKQLDRNADGVVDELEALARFGWDWNRYNRASGEDLKEIAAKRAAALFAGLDKDGDGKLAFEESGSALRDAFERADRSDAAADVAALAEQRAGAYLKALDKDGDGRISRQESRGSTLDRNFGRTDVRDATTQKGDELLTREEIVAALTKFEAGRDGVVSLAELTNYYVETKADGDGVLTAAELRKAVGGYRNGMGDGPRGTPTIDGERVYVEGGNGDLTCLEAATGKSIWHVNLRSGFGGNTPGWGYSESPLVVGDLVIVTPGGKSGTLLALNKITGARVWQSDEVQEGAHYSSPVLAEINGVQQIVQFANQSVFAVSLAEGKPLWRYTSPANGTANCCSPIIEDDLVFASSGYGTGGGLAKIIQAGSRQQAEEVYFEKKMACHHGGIVKLGDYMYSNGGGAVICMEFKTGKIAWQSRGPGKGSLVIADGMLYLLGENHEVALAEATPEAYRETGRFKIEGHGKPSWAHPVVAGGVFYIRDQESLTAYDVRK